MKSKSSLIASAAALAVGSMIGCFPNVPIGHDDGSGGSAESASTGTGSAGGAGGSHDPSGTGGSAGAGASTPEALLKACRIQTLAEDADTLYFYYSRFGECDASGHIASMPKAGGDVDLLAHLESQPNSTTLNRPIELREDGDALYWTSAIGTVNRLSKQGGAVTELASGEEELAGIRVFGGDVYFAEFGPLSADPGMDPPTHGAVKKVSTHGGALKTLASDLTNCDWLAVDASGVYVAAEPDPSPAWAMGQPIFEGVHAGIYHVGLDGSGGAELVAVDPYYAPAYIGQVEVDAGKLLYIADGQDDIWTSPAAPSSLPVPAYAKKVAKNLSGVSSYAFDATNFYVPTVDADTQIWSLVRIPRSGGARKVIAETHHLNIEWIVLDDTYVYWVTRDEASSPTVSTLYRMAK